MIDGVALTKLSNSDCVRYKVHYSCNVMDISSWNMYMLHKIISIANVTWTCYIRYIMGVIYVLLTYQSLDTFIYIHHNFRNPIPLSARATLPSIPALVAREAALG